jgi:hypothetical protein
MDGFDLPVDAREPKANLARVFAALRYQLVDDEDLEEFIYDDAWDTLPCFSKSHSAYLPALSEALSDEEFDVRLYAIRAIKRIGGNLAPIMHSIATAASDKEPWVAWNSISLLHKYGCQNPSEAIAGLKRIANNKQGGVCIRLYAYIGLVKLKHSMLKA